MAPGLNPVLKSWNMKRDEAYGERSYNNWFWEIICLFLAKYFNILNKPTSVAGISSVCNHVCIIRESEKLGQVNANMYFL